MNQNFVELPKAVEMEKYVLSAMLLKDGLVIPKVASILVPDDFFYPEHKIIYRSILQLYSQGAPTDILSISELLRKSGELDKI
ncbi:replicative DNA helicase, partial [bacterium]|nr:replicative DNA helicase [bacterium]